MDWTVIVIILQVIFLEGVLSIDNAAILGTMVADLPENEPIPWPRVLRPLGKALKPVLGMQREGALRVGLLGAYAGRGVMLLLASYVIHNPWLKIIGALYLVRLAVSDLGAGTVTKDDMEGGLTHPSRSTSFWITVLNIELMDLAFSLDNVVAVVALSDKFWVILLGVAFGIIAMRFAAGLFSKIILKAPELKPAAYVLVLNIGVELLLAELAHIELGDGTRFGISVLTIVLVLAYSRLRFLRVFRPVLVWVSQGLGLLNAVIDWLLVPPLALINSMWGGARRLFTARS